MSKKRKAFIHYLPEFGSMATGTLYLGIGIIALLSFFKVRKGGADESSMMMVLNDFVIGKILIVLILAGTACYVAWRIYEVITDPYRYGRSWKGVAKRAGIALSTTTDALVLIAGVRVLLGIGEIQSDGQPVEERAMTGSLLDGGNEWVVILLGLAILATAVVQLIYGFTRGYRERVDEHDFKGPLKTIFHLLGLYGYGARGLLLGVIGFFFLKAGLLRDAEVVVNTDKAFDFIGDNAGHAAFIIVAAGTIAYGCFMFALGFTYKAKK
jgi:hypothetical protein